MKEREKHNQIDVIEFCRERLLCADIVGRWVWVKFDTKPSAELRTALKNFGFRWSQRRGEWSHDCGHPSKRSRSAFHPRTKYGSVPIEEERLLA